MTWVLLGSALWLAFNAGIAWLLYRRFVAARANLEALEQEHRTGAELLIAEALAVYQLRQDLERHGVEGLIKGRQS